jgi:hypothetical protein
MGLKNSCSYYTEWQNDVNTKETCYSSNSREKSDQDCGVALEGHRF